MSRSLRRYEILLPLRLNDGTSVPDEMIGSVVVQLRSQFGAASLETQQIRGIWQYEGEEYRDELVRVFVDVEDLPAARDFFVEFKEMLKREFKQIDVWITTYPIDVL